MLVSHSWMTMEKIPSFRIKHCFNSFHSGSETLVFLKDKMIELSYSDKRLRSFGNMAYVVYCRSIVRFLEKTRSNLNHVY